MLPHPTPLRFYLISAACATRNLGPTESQAPPEQWGGGQGAGDRFPEFPFAIASQASTSGCNVIATDWGWSSADVNRGSLWVTPPVFPPQRQLQCPLLDLRPFRDEAVRVPGGLTASVMSDVAMAKSSEELGHLEGMDSRDQGRMPQFVLDSISIYAKLARVPHRKVGQVRRRRTRWTKPETT